MIQFLVLRVVGSHSSRMAASGSSSRLVAADPPLDGVVTGIREEESL